MSNASHRRLSAGRILARLLVILASLGLALLIVFHQRIPDVSGLGLVVDNLAPWFGLGLPVLVLMALTVGGRGTFITLLVPAVAWAAIFGPAAIPSRLPDTATTLNVATQNVHQDAVASATTLAESGAKIITLQELGEGQVDEVTRTLRRSHPYYYSVSTVGVWSAFPLSNAEPLDLGLGWDRALRVDVATDSGPVRLYTLHAASARPLGHGERDTMLASLGAYLEADQSPRIIAAGDFNATGTDRHFTPVSSQLSEVHYTGWGLPLTWPTSPMPMLAIDHVLVRGTADAAMERLEAGDSDHYALHAAVDFGSR